MPKKPLGARRSTPHAATAEAVAIRRNMTLCAENLALKRELELLRAGVPAPSRLPRIPWQTGCTAQQALGHIRRAMLALLPSASHTPAFSHSYAASVMLALEDCASVLDPPVPQALLTMEALSPILQASNVRECASNNSTALPTSERSFPKQATTCRSIAATALGMSQGQVSTPAAHRNERNHGGYPGTAWTGVQIQRLRAQISQGGNMPYRDIRNWICDHVAEDRQWNAARDFLQELYEKGTDSGQVVLNGRSYSLQQTEKLLANLKRTHWRRRGCILKTGNHFFNVEGSRSIKKILRFRTWPVSICAVSITACLCMS
jgi:hypothetical protein